MIYIDDYVVVNKGLNLDKNQDNIYINGTILPEVNDGLSNYKIKSNTSYNNLYYAVFDGVGGLDNGEYASFIASSIFKQLKNKNSINEIIYKINNSIINKNNEKNIKMGTTASIIEIKNNKLIIKQVGDSPIYILSKDKFIKIIEEKNNNNLLNNYLGKSEEITINSKELKLNHNDKIIICSDGLSNLLGDLEIEYILSQSDDVKFITDKLLNYALMNGGSDNISIITLRVRKNYTIQIVILCLIIIIIVTLLFKYI